MTCRLYERIREHKAGTIEGFTAQYRVHRLVYYEAFPNIQLAIHREKQIKRWRREKKVALIEIDNPTWDDLAAEWGKQVPPLRFAPVGMTNLKNGASSCRSLRSLRSVGMTN